MKAIVFDDDLKLVTDYNKPSLKENEALIKTSMIGICNTDYEITKGYMGYKGVLGHEFVGTVVEVCDKKNEKWLNKRVVGDINCGCNNCEWCAKGLKRHCFNRQTLGIWKKDGCASEYFTLPVENLFEVPENITDKEAVFTEPVAAACEILEQLHIKPCDKVAILGDGKLGLCVSLVFNALNIDYVHIGRHEEKLEISKKIGAKTLLARDCEKYFKTFDVVVEATGSASGLKTSINLTKPRGVLVLKSTIATDEGMNLSGAVCDEITMLGSRCGQFAPAIRLMEKGMIDVKPLISEIFKFDDAIKAFEANKRKDTIKILISNE